MDGMYSGFGTPISVPQAKPKGGMFGAGGPDWASALQAAIYGALAARGNPVGAYGLQTLQQRRQQALEEAKYQRHRQDNLADYAVQQQLQQKYAAPPQPHYFQDNSGNQLAIGPDGKVSEVYHDPLQYKLVPNGLGGVVPVNIRDLMAGQSGGQPAPQGVTFTPIDEGGPSPQGAGGFPRPR